MMLGGGYHGNRLSKPWKESVNEEEIIVLMQDLIKRWSQNRMDGEHFGDWTVRAGIVKATTEGKNFYEGSVLA